MKLICLVENLKTAVAALTRITPNNAMLPSLNGILFQADKNSLKCTSTNLECTLKMEISGQVENTGDVCVPGKILNEICQTLGIGQVVVESDGKILTLSSDKFQTKINTLPTGDFPVLPELSKTAVLKVNSAAAKQMLERVIFAASSSDTQTEISSVLFRGGEDGFFSVATDRYRLAKFQSIKSFTGVWEDVIIPLRVAQEAVRLLASFEGDVEIGVGDQQICWQASGATLTGRIIDGQYPSFEQIILGNYEASVTVEKNAFAQAVKGVGVFVRNKGHVKLSFDKNKLIVEAEGGENGESRFEVEADIKGSPESLLFGYKYLLDGVLSVPSQDIVLQTDSSLSAVSLKGEGSDDFIYIIMPVRT